MEPEMVCWTGRLAADGMTLGMTLGDGFEASIAGCGSSTGCGTRCRFVQSISGRTSSKLECNGQGTG